MKEKQMTVAKSNNGTGSGLKKGFLNVMQKICAFQKTDAYIYCVAVLVFLSNVLSLDLIVFVPLLLLVCITNLFSDDLKTTLPVIMMITFGVSTGHSPAEGDGSYYLSAAVITVLAITVALVFGTAIYRTVKDKSYKNINFKRGIGWGVAGYTACLLLNGIFSGYYDVITFLLGLLFAVTFGPFYFFYASNIKKGDGKNAIDYISKICVVLSCTIIAELAVFYAINYRFGTMLDSAWKGKIYIGWGLSNNIGIMLAFLLPSFFHFVRKNQRGWVYYCLAALSFIAVYFTLCRDALLFGAAAFAVCSVFCCIKGVNRKFSLIATITLGAIAVVVITLAFCGVFPERMFAFILSTKFSDRGRFDIWKNALYVFYESPVFGGGFTAYSKKFNTSFFLGFSHNTVVQIVSSCGLFGFALFFFHRLQTIKLMFYKLNSERFFIVVQILTFILMGLFDIMFLSPYCMIIYVVQLAALENDSLDNPLFVATSFNFN